MTDEYDKPLPEGTYKSHKLLSLPYDEMCGIIGGAHKKEPELSVRDLANKLDLPGDIVREALGYSDLWGYDYEYWYKHFNRKEWK